MLGRRSRKGLVVLQRHELDNGSVETEEAFKHVGRGGVLHFTKRVRVVRDRDGVVLSAVELEDLHTLLVG